MVKKNRPPNVPSPLAASPRPSPTPSPHPDRMRIDPAVVRAVGRGNRQQQQQLLGVPATGSGGGLRVRTFSEGELYR